MVVEVGYDTGREATCKHCAEPLAQVEWSWGMSWAHDSGSPYCDNAPQAEPAETDPEPPS